MIKHTRTVYRENPAAVLAPANPKAAAGSISHPARCPAPLLSRGPTAVQSRQTLTNQGTNRSGWDEISGIQRQRQAQSDRAC